MSRLTAFGVGFAGLLLFGGTISHACGDKSGQVGRGLPALRVYAAQKAKIAVLANSRETGAILAKRQTMLKNVGHQLLVVKDAAELNQALKSGAIDLVLADGADAAIAQGLQSTFRKPAILAVLYKPSKDAFKAAQKTFHYALMASASEVSLLQEIEKAMKSRAQSVAKS